MLSGDLTTMALADVLQWADQTRVAGVLTVERDRELCWMQLENRAIVAASASSSRPVAVERLTGNAEEPMVPVDESALAVEHLYDQFLDAEGTFRFHPGEVRAEDRVAVDLGIAELLMEGMRLLDEWPRLRESYPSDAQRLRATSAGERDALTSLQQAVLACAKRELSLSAARLTLGLSRPALLRRVDELRINGLVTVEGTPKGNDLTGTLVAQATKLLRARQFDEAAHVFVALLTTDPTATRVRQLLREAEREQVLWLHEEIPASSVPRVAREVDRRALTHTDREVLDRINGRWDVSVLVLSSPLREVETLKSLRKLLKLRAIELEWDDG